MVDITRELALGDKGFTAIPQQPGVTEDKQWVASVGGRELVFDSDKEKKEIEAGDWLRHLPSGDRYMVVGHLPTDPEGRMIILDEGTVDLYHRMGVDPLTSMSALLNAEYK